MDTVKIGLIGAGGWGRHHAGGYQNAPNAEVVAVADSDKTKADALAKDFDIPSAYGKVEELLSDKNVEAVSIVVPNKFHAEIAIKALEAGKPVMLDKPFALNSTEAEQVLQTAQRCGTLFMMGMNQRFDINAQTVKPVIENGDLGEVYHAKAHWLRRRGIPERSSWFGQKDLSGGGPMIDIGVHLLDLCLYLIDNFEPVTVSASTYAKIAPGLIAAKQSQNGENSPQKHDVEDFATAMIRMKNGATVQLEASWVLHIEKPNYKNIQLFGTEGGLTMEPPSFYRFGQKEGEYIHTEIARPRELTFPHRSRYQHYADVLQGKTAQLVTWKQSLVVQKILDGIYESARRNREVEIPARD